MARAEALVGQADKSNAQRYAAADLQRAHDELATAQREYDAHKFNEARAEANPPPSTRTSPVRAPRPGRNSRPPAR